MFIKMQRFENEIIDRLRFGLDFTQTICYIIVKNSN